MINKTSVFIKGVTNEEIGKKIKQDTEFDIEFVIQTKKGCFAEIVGDMYAYDRAKEVFPQMEIEN